MSQAVATTITTPSRRGFFKGAFALAAAGPLVATPSALNPAFAAIDPHLEQAAGRSYQCMMAARRAKLAIAAWEKANPLPKLAEWTEGDAEGERTALAAYYSARREHIAAQTKVMRDLQLARTKAAETQATYVLNDLCAKAAAIPAKTMADLIAKANLSSAYDDELRENAIARSLVDDLLAMEAN